MIFEHKNLWRKNIKTSFFRENKEIFNRASREINENLREFNKKNPIYRFDRVRPNGKREVISESNENTFSSVLVENVADLYSRFEEVYISSHDATYEADFNALYNKDYNEEGAQTKNEQEEIERIFQELTGGQKKYDRASLSTLKNEARNLSESERKQKFRNYLRGFFDAEQQVLKSNTEYNTKQSVEFLDAQVQELYKLGFSDLQNVPYFKENVLDKIHNLKGKAKELVDFTATFSYETLQEESKNLEGTPIHQCFEEEKEKLMRKYWREACETEAKKMFGDGLESRKASFSDEQNALCEFLPEHNRNMAWKKVQEGFSNTDKQNAFKAAVREATTQKRTLFRQKVDNFQTQFNVLRGQIKDLQENLEEYATMPENKIAEMILGMSGVKEKLPTDIQEPTKLASRIQYLLSGITNPLERAVKVAEIKNNIDIFKNTGWDELSPDEQAKFLEEGQDMLNQVEAQSEEEKKVEKINKKYLGEKIEKAKEEIEKIRKTYLTDDLGIDYSNGDTKDKKYVNEDIKAICNEILQCHKQNVQEYAYDLDNVTDADKEDLERLNASINLTDAELVALNKKILEAVEARVKPALKIKFVSPIAIYKGIKAIVDHIVHEYEHDDEVNATHVQEHVAGALSGVPGRLGRYAKQAKNKAVSQRESHDADERKTYDYSNFSNTGILDVFNNWSDGETQHLRSLMEQLAERGLIRWDSRIVWEHLENVSGIAMPEEAVEDFAKRDEILAKMIALGFGDDDWYNTFRDKNASSSESKYKARMTEAKELVAKKASDKAFERVLSAHLDAAKSYAADNNGDMGLNKNGQIDNKKGKTFDYASKAVDTELYKALLVGAIDSVGMTAEDMIFYLIRGVATGLLPLEFLTHLEDKNFYNSWPILNYFRKVTMEEILKMDSFLIGVNPGGPNAGLGGVANWTKGRQQEYLFDGKNDRVQKLIHNYLSYQIGDRVEKVVKNWDAVDNDIQQEALYKISTAEMTTVLGKYSGKQVLKEAGIKNGYSGYSTFFSHLEVGQGDPFLNKKIDFAAGVLGNFIVLDGGVRKRYEASATKIDDRTYDSPGAMTTAGITPREYANIMKNFIKAFLDSVDPALFKSVCKCDAREAHDLLFNEEYKDNDAKKKQQSRFIENFASEYLPTLSKNPENRKKLLFLTHVWNEQRAFPNYEDAQNSLISKGKSLNPSLRFNQESFEKWEASEWEKYKDEKTPKEQDILFGK